MKIINSCPFNLEDGKTRILWEITPRCNMKCKHCLFFNNNCKDLKKELTTEEVFKIIDNVCKDTSVKAIWISGGEPLLRNDIVEICKYIKSKNIKPFFNFVIKSRAVCFLFSKSSVSSNKLLNII